MSLESGKPIGIIARQRWARRRTKESEKAGSPASSSKVILLIGCTGVGKSTFVKLASGDESVGIGNNLDPCTKHVKAVSFVDEDGANVTLVDTPGFDDDMLSDFETLKRIAEWIVSSRKKGVGLTGILFFYRISDNRFDGSSSKALANLKDMVGPSFMPSVGLVTTTMSKISPVEREVRLKQLREGYWKDLVRRGAKMYEFNGEAESARTLLKTVEFPEGNTMQLEEELKTRPLSETKVGKRLYSAVSLLLDKIKKLLEWIEESLGLGPKKDSEEVPSPGDPEDLSIGWEDLNQRRPFIITNFPADRLKVPVDQPSNGLARQPAITFGQLQKRLSAATERLAGWDRTGLDPSVLRLVDTVLITSKKGEDTDFLATIVELAEGTLSYLDSRLSDGTESALSDEDRVALERFTSEAQQAVGYIEGDILTPSTIPCNPDHWATSSAGSSTPTLTPSILTTGSRRFSMSSGIRRSSSSFSLRSSDSRDTLASRVSRDWPDTKSFRSFLSGHRKFDSPASETFPSQIPEPQDEHRGRLKVNTT